MKSQVKKDKVRIKATGRLNGTHVITAEGKKAIDPADKSISVSEKLAKQMVESGHWAFLGKVPKGYKTAAEAKAAAIEDEDEIEDEGQEEEEESEDESEEEEEDDESGDDDEVDQKKQKKELKKLLKQLPKKDIEELRTIASELEIDFDDEDGKKELVPKIVKMVNAQLNS